MSKKINIGIDLGPTSIGLAMIDQNGKPVCKTTIVRFKDACNEKDGTPNNKSRRQYRSVRRRLTRKITLKEDFKKL
jgi:CRISPR/Cas system Type II protein with McrA/HNH and RuvC-like nuclease domain